MSKVVIAIKPTFDLPVTLLLLGGGKAEFEVSFRYKTVEEFEATIERWRSPEGQDTTEAERLMDIASAWALEDPFTAEGITAACNRLPGLGLAISRAYGTEYARVREGN